VSYRVSAKKNSIISPRVGKGGNDVQGEGAIKGGERAWRPEFRCATTKIMGPPISWIEKSRLWRESLREQLERTNCPRKESSQSIKSFRPS